MALVAEQLVEEWLNREGYFTIRGIKQGVREIDILALKREGAKMSFRHVEVQVSFRPVSYISKLPGDLVPSFAKSKNSAKERPVDILKRCVDLWIEGKFSTDRIHKMRDHFWPGAEWERHFVHGEVKHGDEIDMIARAGIKTHLFSWILQDIAWREKGSITCNPAGDFGEILDYFYATTEAEEKNRLI